MRSTATKAPVGLWLARGSQRPGMSNVVAVSCNPYEESKEPGRPQAAKKSPVCSFLVFGSHPVGMSNMVAAAAFARGIFNLTHTGIAAELTAASEQRLPPVGGRCRIATKRGVQGSEAGAVVSGMRTPLQGVKHTLGTTTRDRAAVRLHLEYHMPFMDKKPGRGTRSGALLPGFSAFSVNFRPEIVTKLCQ